MNKHILLLALLVISPMLASAQNPDTLNARDYFPLSVGNLWEYEHFMYRFPGGDEIRHEQYAVISSSVVDASEQFELVFSERTSSGGLLERDTLFVWFDDVTSSIAGAKSIGVLSFLICLDSPYSTPPEPSTSDCWPFVTRHSVLSPPLFGETSTPAKQMASFAWAVQLVHGVGAILVSGGCEPCGFFDDMDTWELRYAIVEGKHFGTSLIAAEAHPAAHESRMKVYPNPARGWVYVESESSARITVNDVLGRLVRKADEAPNHRVRIDLGNLRPGVYIVRAGFQARTLVIQ